MKCPSEIELNEYAEGRLTTERRWDVQRHLNDCPGCRADLEGLSWATAAMDALHADDQPEDIHPSPEDLAAMKERRLPPVRRAEVLAHLSTCPECAHIYGALPQPKTEFTLLRHWQPLAAAAGVLIAIAVAFFGMQNGMVSIGQAPQAVVREAKTPQAEPQSAADAPAVPGLAPGSTNAEATTDTAPPAPAAESASSAGGLDAVNAGAGATSATVPGNVPAGPPAPPAGQQGGGSDTPAAPRVTLPSSPRILTFDGGRAPAPSAPVAEALAEPPAPAAPLAPVAAAAMPPPPAPGTGAAGVAKVWPPEAPATTDVGVHAQGFKPAMAPPSRAAASGAGASSTPRATDTARQVNKLKYTREQLLSERNDPAAKAKIKGELRDAGQQQSEQGQGQARAALELPDAPAPQQAARVSSHSS